MTGHRGRWDGRTVSNERVARCRIVIRGCLSDRLGAAFPEMAIARGAGTTVLSGPTDRADLQLVLDRLRDLGLEPLTVDVDP
jgi:hypothetical protein